MKTLMKNLRLKNPQEAESGYESLQWMSTLPPIGTRQAKNEIRQNGRRGRRSTVATPGEKCFLAGAHSGGQEIIASPNLAATEIIVIDLHITVIAACRQNHMKIAGLH